ncbi:hypothetical protein [Streptomyces lushanensis]|uniref:hypothetical protein n=1 Tax=Streptomyces lushanensis TaxID=1434255 RepID=UPI000829803B|nr:hypothetical protein [Streptomyces lushanensis]
MNQNGPQGHTQMLLLLLVAVLALAFVFLAYLAHQHPSIAEPLMVATGGVAVLLAVIAFGVEL